ncbi:MAG: prenyltransferase/squalene oxidase repeat-containing protein [Nitrososphaeria archaeon]
MIKIPSKVIPNIVAYIKSRQGEDGGYLFYQYEDIFESSIDDTYYALASLKLLGEKIPNKNKTLKFLYSKTEDLNLHSAYYWANALYTLQEHLEEKSKVTALSVLNEKANKWIERLARSDMLDFERINLESNFESQGSSTEISAIELPTQLEQLFKTLDTIKKLGLSIKQPNIKDEIIKKVLNFHKPDYGFGLTNSDISSTFYSLTILSMLDYPLTNLKTWDWILALEDREGGFNVKINSRFRVLEYTCEAVKALKLLGKKPKFIQSHVNFILECQNANGGFRRSIFAGISTLKDTFYAVSTFAELDLLTL